MAITRFNAKNGLAVGTGSIGVVDSEGNVEAKNVGVTGSITPDASGLYDIGSPTKVWRNLYVSNISGSLTGSNVTAGQVVVAGTGGVLSGSNNFWWDNSKRSVGIGTSTLLASLHVSGSSDSTLRAALFRGGVASPATPLLEVQDSSGVSLLVVSGSGNVGVGTSGNPGAGRVIGSLTLTNGGTGYTNGTYSQVALTTVTGTGSGATADIIVASGIVTTVVLRSPGQGYTVSDTLSCSSIGAGSNFLVTVATTASILRSDGTVVAPRIGAGTTSPRAGLDVASGGGMISGATRLTLSPSGTNSAIETMFAIHGTVNPTTSNYGLWLAPQYDLVAGTVNNPTIRGIDCSPSISASSAGTTQSVSVVGANINAQRWSASDLSTISTSLISAVRGTATIGASTGAASTASVQCFNGLYQVQQAGHTVTSGSVYTCRVQNTGTTTTLSLYGIDTATFSNSGTIGTFYGLRLSTITNTGTITTRYGISQEDTAAKNYLAGNTGIGGSNPTARLAVTGSTADNTADALHVLNSSNASMLYVRNDGLVGVGTSSSTARFQVQGSTTATTPTMIVREGVASPTGGVGAFDVQNSAGTSLLFVSGSGAVGIGTTVSQLPTHKLHVSGKIGGGIYLDSSLEFLADGTTELKANSNLKLGYLLTTVINSSGNVGIGTGTPAARLFVSGSSTATTPTMVVKEGVVSPTGGAGTFDVQNSAGTSLLFVSGSGFVGLGTSATNSTDGLTSYEVLLADTKFLSLRESLTNKSIGIRFAANGGATASSWTTNTSTGEVKLFGTTNFFWTLYTNNSEKLRIDTSGNVGIGTTTPFGAKLAIYGGTLPTGASGKSNLSFATNLSAGRLVSNSGGGISVINTYFDSSDVEISAGTTSGWTSGIVASGRSSSSTTPDSVVLYTRSAERVRVYGTSALMSVTASIEPGDNNTYNLGSSTKSWGDLYARTGSFSGDVSITGNLTVLGTQTIISSSQVNIGDNIILLNSVANPQQYGGIYVADTTANTTGSILWNSSTDRWVAGLVGNETNLVTTGSTDNLYNKTLPISGLNSSTISGGTQGGIGYFNTSGYLSSSAAGTSGQILQSAETSSPTWVNFGTLVSSNNVITGSGTAGYHAKFTSGNAVSNGVIYDDGTNVAVGTTSTNGNRFSVSGTTALSGSTLPGITNTYDLGSTSSVWRGIFASSGSFSALVTSASTTSSTYAKTYAPGEAGKLTATKDITAAGTATVALEANNGAVMFDITIVASESGFSVAKKYTVATQYGASPVVFKIVDTGPFSGADFTVSFSKPTASKTLCTITNSDSSTHNFAITLDVAATSTGTTTGTTVTIF